MSHDNSLEIIQGLRLENEMLLGELHRTQEELACALDKIKLADTVGDVGTTGRRVADVLASSRSAGKTYGAADHVKKLLAYRLGAIALHHSTSIYSWFRLPGALLAEAGKAKGGDNWNDKSAELILCHFADAEEGRRVMRHLSYRIGKLLLDCYRNPLRVIWLPWSIPNELREFKRYRAG